MSHFHNEYSTTALDLEDLPAIDVDDVDDDDDEDVEEPPSKKIRRRTYDKWADLEIWYGLKCTYPFLSPTNWPDDAFVQLALSKQPYRPISGEKQLTTWGNFKEELEESIMPGTEDEKVFPNGVASGARLKERFKEIMNWMKKRKGVVPLRTGMDDEKTSSRMMQGLLDLYDDYMKYLDESEKPQSTKSKSSITPTVYDIDQPNPLTRALSIFSDVIGKSVETYEVGNVNDLITEKFNVQIALLKQEPHSKSYNAHMDRIKELNEEIKEALEY